MSLLEIILNVGLINIIGIHDLWNRNWTTNFGASMDISMSLIYGIIWKKWTEFLKHPGTWRVKIFTFHLIMIPRYLWMSCWDWTQKQLIFILGIMMGPIINHCPWLIYVTTISMLVLEMVFMNKESGLKRIPDVEGYKICFMQTYKMHPPVPRAWGSLNGVQLSQEFVGWIEKCGYVFSSLGCFINRIGNKGVDLAISMHDSSRNYYLRKLHPRMERLMLVCNTILNVFHLDEGMVKWFEMQSSLISLESLYMLKKGHLNCNRVSGISSIQTKRRVNFNSYRFPKIFLIIFTTFQICSSTVCSRFNQFLPKKNSDKEWAFDWDLHGCPDLEIEGENKKTGRQFYYNNNNEIVCFTATAEPGLILTNTSDVDMNSEDFSLNSNSTEFGTDNCATHHICSERDLFVGEIKPISNIGVKGISGSAMAEGIGTIEFTIVDDNKEEHKIRLENVIYLPQAAKNLISISQWAKDKKDNCGVLSRGNCSIFLWNNDLNTKMIPHCPQCPIPMMEVNNSSDVLTLLASNDHGAVVNEGPLMPEGNPGMEFQEESPEDDSDK